MSHKRAEQLEGMARVFERQGWGRGGYDGGAGVPCMQNAADKVGLPHSYLTRRGRDYRWNDKQHSRAAVVRECKRMAEHERRGVAHQQRKAEQQAKKAEAINTARQHTSAAPIKALGAALVMLLVAGVVLRVVWPLLAAFLTTLLSYLLVLGEAAGLTAATIAMAAVIHWATKARRVRVEQRTSLEARQAEVLEAIEERAQLFALPAGNTVADEALKQAWMPAEEKEEKVWVGASRSASR